MISIILIDEESVLQEKLSHLIQQNQEYQIILHCKNKVQLNEGLSKISQESLEELTKNQNKLIAVIDVKTEDGENGIKLVKPLLEKNINSLIYSMIHTPARITTALEEGAKGYISKNSDLEEILHAINQVSQGNVYIQPELYACVMNILSVIMKLTKREFTIVTEIKKGNSKHEIAEILDISVRTVENNLVTIYKKFGVKNWNELKEKI